MKVINEHIKELEKRLVSAKKTKKSKSSDLNKIAAMITKFKESLPRVTTIVKELKVKEKYDPYLKEMIADLKSALKL